MVEPIDRAWIMGVLIENWRGIKKLVLSDLKKTNILLGANGSCKTSVLDAIHQLARLVTPQSGPVLSWHQSTQRRHKAEEQYPLRVQLVLKQPYFEEAYKTDKSFQGLRSVLSSVKPRYAEAILRILRYSFVELVRPSKEHSMTHGLKFWEPPDWFPLPEQDRAAFALRRELMENLGPNVSGWSDHVTKIARYWPNESRLGRIALVPASRERLEVLYAPHSHQGDTPERRLWNMQQESFGLWVQKKFIKRVQALGVDIPPIEIRTSATVFNRETLDDSTFDVPEEVEARGLRDAYKVLAAFDDPHPEHIPDIVLLDEPELSKNEGVQRALLDCLTETFPRTQFIIATHSSVFSEDRPNTSIHFLKREGDGVEAVFVGPESQKARGALREALGISNAQVFSLSHVLYLEGQTEEECVTRILRALGSPPGPSARVSIANAGGVGKLNVEWIKPQLRILQGTWAKASIWADAEGKVPAQREDLISQFPAVLETERFVIWSDVDKRYVQFIDTFPADVCKEALKQLLEEAGFTMPADVGTAFPPMVEGKKESWLSNVWHKTTSSGFPKVQFGIKMGEKIAAMIEKGTADGIVAVKLCRDLLQRIQKR